MSDEKDENSGKGVGFIFGGLTVAAMIAAFTWLHHRDPSGALDAWLDGTDRLVVREYRLDEGDEVERIAVVELRTGKRLVDRAPDGRPFAVRKGKIWFSGRKGVEAWTLPGLESVPLPKLALADSNVCFDSTHVRLALTDGRYAVLDLAEGKQVPDQPVTCDTYGRGANALQSSTSTATTKRDGDSQRMVLEVGGARFGGSETFLEPQYVDGVEADGDVFVVHRAQLGDDRELLLSRVGRGAKKWTVSLADCGATERAVFVPPVLVMVGHNGIDTLDVTTGAVLWRTGK